MGSASLAMSPRATLLDLALVNHWDCLAGKMVRVTVHAFEFSE